MGMPMAISIEPTTACNLRCPECPSGLRSSTRPTGNLPLEYFKMIIDSLHNNLCYLNLYFQGEPFLNKHFFEMISYSHQKGIFTVTSTNAHFLDDHNAKKTVLSGLDKLIISMDGADQETYKKYRVGGDLNKVLEGVKLVKKWKKKLKKHHPLIFLQFIIFKTNQHQVGEIQKIASQLGIDHLSLKTAQIYDYSMKSALIPDNPEWRRYQLRPDGVFQIENNLDHHCWRMWSSSVITWDGRIVPCCFDKDANHQMGKLGNLSFRQIWRGEPYNSFRKQILLSRDEIEICSNCSEGTKIQL
jgi:radical SAM protein with 4Fe4S-binding SPASM domain